MKQCAGDLSLLLQLPSQPKPARISIMGQRRGSRAYACAGKRVRENVCGGERYVYKMVVSGIGPG